MTEISLRGPGQGARQTDSHAQKLHDVRVYRFNEVRPPAVAKLDVDQCLERQDHCWHGNCSVHLGHTSGSIEHVALKGPHYKAASARAYSLIEQYKFIACSFHVANQGINNMNIINRIFRLSVAVGVGCAALIATVPASADVARYQVLTLQYDSVDYYLPASGPYSQSFTLTFNPCDGTVSGPGLVPGFGVSQTQGSINGALLSYTSTYNVEPGYTVTVNNAVVLNDYSFSGLWSDNYSVGAQSGVVVSNIPGVTSTAYRNHGDFVSQSPDKNDAAHSCIGMPIPKQ